MKHCNHFTDLKTLRKTYLEIKQFLKQETGEKDISLKTKIAEDLGFYGDDNLELLNKFVIKYNLQADGFNYSSYFESEAGLFNNGMFVVYLLLFPFYFTIWIAKIITTKPANWKRIRLYPEWKRNPEPKDLTFGDLVVWYLKGNFGLRENINVALQ